MVNATDWLNQYYPTNGTCTNTNDTLNCGSNPKKRNQITSLDISNQNLERILELEDFTGLLKLNASCNNLTGFNLAGYTNMTTFIYESRIIQEVDFSHNVHTGNFGNWTAPSLKVFNFSYNQLNSASFTATNLIYLDASNNNLNNLNLSQAIQNLEVLNCSNNPLNSFGDGLTLTNAPNLKFFDCLGVKFNTIPTMPPCPIPNTTICSVNNPLGAGIGVGIGSSAIITLVVAYICQVISGNWFSGC